MSDKHDCAAEGCTAQCRYEILMCLYHWSMVPKHIQKVVNTAWRAFQEDSRNQGIYFAARQAAVDAVKQKVGA